jgi:hypothetical protein
MWTTETMRRRAVQLDLTRRWAVAQASPGSNRFSGLAITKSDSRARPEISGPATVGIANVPRCCCPGISRYVERAPKRMRCWRMSLHTCGEAISPRTCSTEWHLAAGGLPSALWLTRARLAETRELVCDAMAAEAVGGREGYARSLLRLASMLSHRNAPSASFTPSGFSMPTFLRGEL